MGMMLDHLVLVGVDFRHARVDVRERVALDDDALARLHEAALPHAEELVVLRTCNRTELVAWLRDPATGVEALAEAWRSAVGMPPGEPAPPFQFLRGFPGARHLLRVSAGLESQILGDIHILGQLRRGYRDAREAGRVGPHLHRLFDAALRAGKRVRRETELMAGHRSVGSEAARHLLSLLPEGAPRRILVVGTGKVGSHAARALAAEEGVEVVLLNRTAERARNLAAEWGGAWGGMDDLATWLPEVGGLLVATGAPGPWVDHRILAARAPARVLPVVDLSMPRNVAPGVARLPGVVLSDLDDVHPEAAAVEEARQGAIPRAEGIVEDETGSFGAWLVAAEARAALRPLQEWILEVSRREVGFVADGDPEQVERAARRIAARVLSRPMMALRGDGTRPAPGMEGAGALSRTFEQLFSDASAAGGAHPEPR
jgi:glutamyl-tRNA reductase